MFYVKGIETLIRTNFRNGSALFGQPGQELAQPVKRSLQSFAVSDDQDADHQDAQGYFRHAARIAPLRNCLAL
jgi:hypothetical protein